MRDVLETLRKLPEKCAAVMQGQAVFIRRGASDTAPAHFPADQVDQWNMLHSVSPEQAQAMIVGVTLGWDKDGADPDSHSSDLGGEPGPFDWVFAATVCAEVTVSAHTEEEALKAARSELESDQVVFLKERWTVESIDLIETTNPRA